MKNNALIVYSAMQGLQYHDFLPHSRFNHPKAFGGRSLVFIRLKRESLGLYTSILILLMTLSLSKAYAQWQPLTSGTTNNLNEIHFPVSDTGYVVGEKGTVLRTMNGGFVWDKLNTFQTITFHELHFLNGQEGWIVGDSGTICKTINAGNNWNCRNLPGADSIQLMAVYAINRQELIVGGFHTDQTGYMAKSTDGGLTWQRAYIENYLWAVGILKIGMINPTIGFATTRGIVLKTTDGGLNWSILDTASVKSGAMFLVLEDLACFPNNDTVYACGWYPGYFGRSTNGGAQWQHDYAFDFYNLDFINPRVGYVGGWGNMRKTTDGGQTFVDASGGNTLLVSNIYSLDFTDEWTGYACGTGGKIIKTMNGGVTSVFDNEVEERVKCFPNPTSGFVKLSKPSKVKLYDISGKQLEEWDTTNSLDLTSRPNGLYMLQLISQEDGFVQFTKLKKVN